MPLTTDELDLITLTNPPGGHVVEPAAAPPTTAVPPAATPASPPEAAAAPAGLIPGAPTDATALTRRSLANRPWTQRGRAQYIGLPIVTASLAVAEAATTASYFNAPKNDPRNSGIDLSLSGTWDGTVVLERCFNADCVDEDNIAVTAVWHIVETFTANVEKTIQNYNAAVKWRLRMTVRNSGACVARLSQA